ncbi:pyridoxal-phosphate-dependent aminotransferase family protein [Thalassovita aquimarina]|uniref:Alanine--glyoxylate aminotransferase family protein n=1 Tax=Thalassovita aquimarina TaxID=2785917 RepID=A0ABS5HTC5_9RHOB|nr:aminotransferase class V-fold PLP-dependent enzyme [Thalassovita aquimarina]MBR9652232.1 alanine--glyoxylate aminotransferase family protein [Thalassovita aquimarina]
MNLSNGRPYLAIPGPSVMPEEVLRAMHRSAPNIYEGALIEMTAGIIPDLRRVARTEHNAAIYIGNGHGAWEAALSNVVAAGDRILVPATGRFGHGWADMAEGLGVEVEMIDFGRNRPFDLNRVEEALRADTKGRIKAVLGTHVDTSSSVLNDIAGLRAVLDAVGHPALLMADCIASLACDRFEMDAWGVDVMVAGSQKGLMTPPGMGFVFASPRAFEARARMERVSRYWDWTPRFNPESFYQYFGGTAPTHHLYGLRAALDMIHAEGLENVWRRHDVLARAIWAAAERWGQDGPLRLNVADPDHRARSVTSLRLGLPYGHQLREWVEANAGVTLGIGLGMSEEGDPDGRGYFRIGHMGHLNAHMVIGMLGTIDTAFKALDVPHGKGALEAAASVMAEG